VKLELTANIVVGLIWLIDLLVILNSSLKASRTAIRRSNNSLGHGQTWCGDTRPEQLGLQVQTDPHSPRQFRVNGVVENVPEFGEAFGCKVGQPMMPQEVCRVW
jgi:predicted metalloendopeptidase